MTHQEEALDYLEEQIPALSASAVTVAYWAALASGQSVLEVEGDAIVEVFPDGTRRVVKATDPALAVEAGTKLVLR